MHKGSTNADRDKLTSLSKIFVDSFNLSKFIVSGVMALSPEPPKQRWASSASVLYGLEGEFDSSSRDAS